MQLFVLGMHRSGTSGVTRLLNMAGAYFGAEGVATDTNEENRKGFWERRDVRRACDGLLQESGFDWWKVAGFSLDAISDDVRARHLEDFEKIIQQLDAHRPWVVKEPRLSILFPLLLPLLEVPVCIHVTREPLEVAESLLKRNDFPVAAGVAMWELYTIGAFRGSEGTPRVLVRYEDLIADPVVTTTHLIEQLTALGVYGLRVPTEREITAFVSPDLRHQRRDPASRAVWMNAQQAHLAAAIDDGTVLDPAGVPATVSEAAFEALRVLEAHARLPELEKEIERRDSKIAELEQKHERLEERIATANARVHEHERALAETERRLRSISRSRSIRIATRLSSVRGLLKPGWSRRKGALDRVIEGLEQSRREIGRGDTDGGPPPPQSHPTDVAATTPGSATGRSRGVRARPKVSVLAWDVGHNPLGRAYVMAGVLGRKFDVDIWGAQFERYGSSVWAPLRDSEIPIHAFEGRPFPEHLAVMEDVASRIDADAVWVSKPRLPSYGLGALAKQMHNRPLVLDVDDHELSFFDEDTGLDPNDLRRMRKQELELPFERAWTRLCETFINAADQITVSNAALEARFGGVIVTHARDERIFDPARYDRAETRRSLGVGDTERLLLFGGTPRVHKGIVEVLRALERLGDDRYRVMLFGTRELEALRPEIGDLDRWVLALPYQQFSDLPRLVGAADLACVLQDPRHPVARYQLPAKVTDALAMSVPCLVRPVPPLRSLVDKGVLQVLQDGEPLPERIAAIFEHREHALDRAAAGRELFEESYSYTAVSEIVAPVFEQLMEAAPPMSRRLETMIDLPREIFGSQKQRERAEAFPARVPGRPRRRVAPGEQYDVVMFWKQNDTGIYGRRQDMFAKYLAQSGRVRTIVHFDNPTTPEQLYKQYRAAGATADQSRLVVRQTVSRLLRRRDTDLTHFYTFLHGGRLSRKVGLPRRNQYPDYVKSVLAKHGIGTRPTVFWVYPTNDDLPRIIDELDPEIVVADVVDDNRTWYDEGSAHYERVERNYEQVLARSDVVLANCEPVAASMARFAPDVQVVANGAELRNDAAAAPRPKALSALSGPIIGYVGNLSSRIDIPLLETLARDHPAWQFVFVGSAHLDRSIMRLESIPNVHFVGVKPYEETLKFIQHFDVALIPHIDNEMTRSMNPLKAFVYCSTGVPVVSTPIANLGELAELITVAEGADGFANAIEAALQAGRRAPATEVLRPLSWEVRIARALDLVDAAAGAPDHAVDAPAGNAGS
jgi:hypothetical protein